MPDHAFWNFKADPILRQESVNVLTEFVAMGKTVEAGVQGTVICTKRGGSKDIRFGGVGIIYDLPVRAFSNLRVEKTEAFEFERRILVVPHVWEAMEHPDPTGAQLRTIAKLLLWRLPTLVFLSGEVPIVHAADSNRLSRIHFPPLRSKGGKSILEKWSRESGKDFQIS